ncbi:MAG: ADP-ribosylglycohydrolase family protein [Lentisphaeria bacterium]|nr:ADP-ribosylglycohydrolase family protein [Lentisphaeria bacterium]
MLGAMIGDMIGAPYEMPENNIKTKNFPLWQIRSRVTDDSVLTCAVAAAFMEYLRHPRTVDPHRELVNQLKIFGNSHQFVPYGRRFRQWIEDYTDTKPYHSFSDGAPMRVSSVAWLWNDLKTVETMAKVSAEVTHDHPEAIRGAQAVAAAIFLARRGTTKAEIRKYIEAHYYSLDFTIDGIRAEYYGGLACSETVPQAVVSFLEAESFEDAVRNAVSLGGDSDTLACMAGGLAEAFFGIPDEIVCEGEKRLPADLRQVLDDFRVYTAQSSARRG